MIEDMNARQLSAGTQKAHIRSCKRFAAYFGRSPETATRNDIRQFQHHLAEDAVSLGTGNVVMTGVKFLFRVTLRRLDLVEEIYHLNEPQRVPVILNANEIKRLLAVARPLKTTIRCPMPRPPMSRGNTSSHVLPAVAE
jgi:site-specific recombinase XerD